MLINWGCLVEENFSGKPYVEEDNIRTFSSDIDPSELVWHRDREDRLITVVSGEEWQLQYDDKYPIQLEEYVSYYIPKMQYHRIIKGKTDLVLIILKGE